MKISPSLPGYIAQGIIGGSMTVLLCANAGSSCKPTASPRDAEAGSVVPVIEAGAAVANGACTLLEGVTQNQTVISICAYVEEIASIATFIADLRVTDGGHPALSLSGECTLLPGSHVCATRGELGRAISAIVVQRQARFLRDAGAR